MPEPDLDTLDLSTLPFWQWDTAPTPLPTADCGLTLDSIFPFRELPDTVYRTSLFQKHTLQVEHPGLASRPNPAEPAWVFGMLVVLCGLLCLYYRQHKIRLVELLHSTIDRRAMDRLLRNCGLNRPTLLMPMGLLAVGAVSIGVWQMAMASTGIVGLGLLAGGLAAAYMTRNGLWRVMGAVFDAEASVSTYITSNYLFHLVLATGLVPLLFPMVYFGAGSEVLAYLALGLTALLFMVRIVRGLKLFLTITRGSELYLFYYLCTVEVVPILLLIKWFTTQ